MSSSPRLKTGFNTPAHRNKTNQINRQLSGVFGIIRVTFRDSAIDYLWKPVVCFIYQYLSDRVRLGGKRMHYAHISRDAISGALKFQTCADHSRGTAALAQGILAKCDLAAAGYLAGLLHDCGKFTDEFDSYLTKATNNKPVQKGSVIHTFAGVAYLLASFHSKSPVLTLVDLAAEVLAVSIGGHHGLLDIWDEHHQSGLEHRLTKQPDYDARAIKAFHQPVKEAMGGVGEPAGPLTVIVSGGFADGAVFLASGEKSACQKRRSSRSFLVE